jgi:polyhydroxyalkanoate synthesis regulator phasin
MKIQPHIMRATALLAFINVMPLNAQSGSPEAASIRSVEALEKRVDKVEARLGRNVTTPTATNNLERRLDDIEDRLDDLEKKVKDLEKLERRVRDLERKK